MKIKLIKPTKCAQDVHETTKYPRPWFKPKPELPAGTILEVSDVGRISLVYIIAVYCQTK